METPEQIKLRLESAIPGLRAEVVPNGSPGNPASLWVDNEHALAAACFLRDDDALALDYVSNVTGVDWLPAEITEKTRSKRLIDGVEKEVEETRVVQRPGHLEAVYHLYSMSRKQGPLVLRLRTADRGANAVLPSLTSVWRGAELQEREIFDLYGIRFEGHPDLRRILMWEGYQDHPMRKDYVDPDDFEYEPTPHDEVLERAKAHYPNAGGMRA